jgi:DNA relaxase NicK
MRVWDAGIDYLTMTFEAGHKDYVQALSSVAAEMSLSAHEKEPILPATWNGYVGKRQGKLMLGEREDGMIVRVSGARSRHIAQTLKERNINGKATRIDFQTTAQTGEPVECYLQGVHRKVSQATSAENGRSARNLARYSYRGKPCGVAVGSRSSNNYSRIYNKTLEQCGKVAPNLVRFENEVKGKRAVQAWNMYAASAQPYYLSCSLVKAEMEGFGVNMDWLATGEKVEFASSWEPTNTEKQLNWLQHNVRPTVLQLVDKIGREEVLLALGLNQ